MNSAAIKSFSVFGLFGTMDVQIHFDDDVKILAGENGLGKTQMLNMFYHTLNRDFYKLNEFKFDILKVEFEDEVIIIPKDEILRLTEKLMEFPEVKDYIHEFGMPHFNLVRKKFYQNKGNRNAFEREMEYGSRSRKYPYHRIFRILDLLDDKSMPLLTPFLAECEEKIIKCLNGNKILYFPTYRRVEEDLHVLGYDEDEMRMSHDNTLIQFGMDDVQRRFRSIEHAIGQLLKEGLAQFTKDILNVVIEDTEPENSFLDKINTEDIDIILSRVGNMLPQSQKDSVKNIIANKTFKNPLSGYLLQKLVDIYEKQKELDNSVKVYRDICNKYLINKRIFYDESLIKIYVQSNIDNQKILLSQLSSGEKQIISIFSKIYLSDRDRKYIVLFDEPELSLSMLWQKQLLPDILNSNKCSFMLAVTHSPFIFDNRLDNFAVGLAEFVTESKKLVMKPNGE